MIPLNDRQILAQNIQEAHEAGARWKPACTLAGITLRTLQRWQASEGEIRADARPHAMRATPAHALSPAERQAVLTVANEPRFAAMPPARIVPKLADEGVYIASESTFSRVLRSAGQTHHRGRAKTPRPSRPPTTHMATGPRQVWCWDMTYLPAEVAGRWFYLYLILDLYSRKIVGTTVQDTDDAPTMPRISPGVQRLRKGFMVSPRSLCSMVTMGQRSRPPRYSPCSTGSV